MYHANLPSFSGGYVGVDVFFVISGFLISQLIRNDLQSGRFSLLSFYERRIRRIFPALIAVLLFVSVAASWLLLPQDLVRYGRSLVATALFSSNLFFAQAGYFTPEAHEFPLLHTWSLAVEEQFYIVYPLLLWAIFRHASKSVALIIVLLALASFIFAGAMLITNPQAAFYLPHTRGWELALGCTLALTSIAPQAPRVVRDSVGLLGLGMIIGAVVLYTDETTFPGTAALVPCLGAAFVIWAGADGRRHMAASILTSRPLVLTGLISYSLYLWHWPLLTFASYPSVAEPPAWIRVGLLVLSYLFALVTWRWVERPFRGRRGILTRPQLIYGGVAAMSAILAFGLVIPGQRGWPGRLEPDVRRIAAGHNEHAAIRDACYETNANDVRKDRLCRTGHASAPATFIVWGDSHARALVYAVGRAASTYGRSGLMAPQPGCPPVLDVNPIGQRRNLQCSKTAAAVLDYLRAHREIKDVILISRWALLIEGTFYAPESGQTVLLSDREVRAQDRAQNPRIFERALYRTVDELAAAHKRIWIVGPVPEVGVNVPRALANARRFGFDVDIGPSRTAFEARQNVTLAILGGAARRGATLVPVHEALCNEVTCSVESVEGKPLYYDDDHLSYSGGRTIVPALQAIFDNQVAQRAETRPRD